MRSDSKNVSNDTKTIKLLDGSLYGQFQFNTNDCIGTGSFGKTLKGQLIYNYRLINKYH